MGSPYVMGPSQWYVNTGTGKAWQYLGMAEGDTSVDLSSEWDGIQIDGGGFRLDYDRQFFGATAAVSGDLAYWNESVLDLLKNFVNDASATPGQWSDGTIGTLVRTEGKAFGLVITSQYASKPSYLAAGAHPVIYFPWAVPLSMRRGLSTRASRERMAFDCLPVLNGKGGGVLYHNSISFSLPTPS